MRVERGLGDEHVRLDMGCENVGAWKRFEVLCAVWVFMHTNIDTGARIHPYIHTRARIHTRRHSRARTQT